MEAEGIKKLLRELSEVDQQIAGYEQQIRQLKGKKHKLRQQLNKAHIDTWPEWMPRTLGPVPKMPEFKPVGTQHD